jgi:hypothetical protein
MRALTRLENKQNYGAIYTTYFYLPPKNLQQKPAKSSLKTGFKNSF